MVSSGGCVLAKGYRVVPQELWPQGEDAPTTQKDAPTTQQKGIAITRQEGAATAGYRYLHLKEHRGVFKATEDAAAGAQVQEFPKSRTLFVGNVDDQGGRLCRKAITNRLKRALGACGDIVHVQVSATPEGAKDCATRVGKRIISTSRFAHVCFASGEGVQAALALQVVSSGARPSVEHLSAKGKKGRTGEEEDTSPVAEREEENLDENGDETLGYASLIQRHRRNFPPRSQLQAEVDSIMEAFEDEEAAEAARRKVLIEQPLDDDGFVTVTYKKKRGRNSGNSLPVAGDLAGADAGPQKKKRKGAGALPDFYRFQMRESRREQLVSLRTKFEQDKARVAKMKEQRKFRPF